MDHYIVYIHRASAYNNGVVGLHHVGGWAAMYRVALTILSYKEKELLVVDLGEVGKTMREWKGTQIIGG